MRSLNVRRNSKRFNTEFVRSIISITCCLHGQARLNRGGRGLAIVLDGCNIQKDSCDLPNLGKWAETFSLKRSSSACARLDEI